MIGRRWCGVLGIAAALGALGCDGQQYVSPDTVALVVTEDATGQQRVNECQYIPVLLGSRNLSRYAVDDALRVIVDITRDEVTLSFEGTPELVEPFRVPSERFDGAAQETLPAPPAGYSAALSSPCTP